ncbi:type II secretion system protein [Kitasatospora sp. NPDC096147]|uniref:type IV pilus modification PilV family protein n=1 Tax=Kitasatospora sp. NPDC096147 TaxID=3364093 RepID=UPI0037F582CB
MTAPVRARSGGERRGGERRGGPRGEAGETLVEALVAVALIGVAFVAVLGGIGTALVSSATQQRVTGADALVRSTAETILGGPYTACATGYPTPTPPPGFTVTVEVEYWDGTAAFGRRCPAADTGVQKLTLTVHPTGPPGRQSVRDTVLEVVKRAAVAS